MTDRVVVVTGAARGIGAATVHALVNDGACVIAIDAAADDPVLDYSLGTREQLDEVVAGGGDRVFGAVADVRDQQALTGAVNAGVAHFGRLDAAVAAAGVVAGGEPLWEVSDARWNAVVDTDITGVFHLVRATIPRIIADSPAGGGRFVAVASAAGTLGLPRMGPYAVAKHGVVGLTKSLAADLAGTGVTANAVAPGSTRTPILDASAAVYGLDSTEAFVQHQAPLGRLIEPTEIAAAIVWLCSPAASALTGAIIGVDGVMTAT